jgi:hypothetical protein
MSGTNREHGFTGALRSALFLLILLLFPWPLALLYVLGVPIGWIYGVVYVGWAAFALLLVYLSTLPMTKATKWPHRRVMYAAGFGEFMWYFVTNTILRVPAVLNWLVFLLLAVLCFVEATVVRRQEVWARRQP